MRPLRQLLGRTTTGPDASKPDDGPIVPAKPWNTLYTLQSGAVADVDERGAIYPRSRPVSVETWFGHGERWIRGGVGDGLRQTRLEGLPIIETRQKLDDGDVLQTVWADESGGSQGRVVIELSNETNVSVVAAVVVRPGGLVSDGHIDVARCAGSMLVIDKLPLVELGRTPGAVVTAIDDADASGLLAQLNLGEVEIAGSEALDSGDGRASIAAIIPLTRGATKQIEVVDGREEQTVAAAPLDTVQAGWKAHLRGTMDFDLPGWPKHLPAALLTSLVGSTSSLGRPLGDTAWEASNDSIRVVALARVGMDWAAAHVADALLADVIEGQIERDRWPEMGVVCAAISGSPEGQEVLARHADAVSAVAGYCLTKARTPNLVAPLVAAVGAAHGADAGRDAASIQGSMKNPADGLVYARHGYGIASEAAEVVSERVGAKGKPDAEFVGLAMAASASSDFSYEPLVPLRSIAGSTWRWPHSGCGDSPHARAGLLVGLASLCISESQDGDGTTIIDVFPGASPRWLGQKVAFTNGVTSVGPLSVALRWHGERAAILWEFADLDPDDADSEGQSPTVRNGFAIRCSAIDPTFTTSERSGEALLEEPKALIAERDALASRSANSAAGSSKPGPSKPLL